MVLCEHLLDLVCYCLPESLQTHYRYAHQRHLRYRHPQTASFSPQIGEHWDAVAALLKVVTVIGLPSRALSVLMVCKSTVVELEELWVSLAFSGYEPFLELVELVKVKMEG